jgi:RNA polymerase sigma-70 factor (ECF subfamily)
MDRSQAALTDTELLPLLRAGESRAFEEILRRYEAKVFSLVRGMTRNDGDAQDALQDTFLSVYQKIGTFKGESRLSTWIYRIAVNAALMTIRKRKRDERTVSIDEYLPAFDGKGQVVAAIPDGGPRADQALLNKELGGYLKESIQALPPDDRAIVILRDQEGLSNEEVSAVMNMSVPAIKSRLHRARLYLRGRLRRYRGGGGSR